MFDKIFKKEYILLLCYNFNNGSKCTFLLMKYAVSCLSRLLAYFAQHAYAAIVIVFVSVLHALENCFKLKGKTHEVLVNMSVNWPHGLVVNIKTAINRF